MEKLNFDKKSTTSHLYSQYKDLITRFHIDDRDTYAFLTNGRIFYFNFHIYKVLITIK